MLVGGLGVCTLACGGVIAAPHPIFYAPFDGTATASVAAGQAEPLQAERLAFTLGLKGQAVRLDPKIRSRLAYAFDGNVQSRQGSVALWFKPEWNDRTAGNRHYFFAFDYPWNASRAGTGALYLWDHCGRCRADRSDMNDHYQTARSPFRTNIWHHLAYVCTVFSFGFRNAPLSYVMPFWNQLRQPRLRQEVIHIYPVLQRNKGSNSSA